MILPSSSSSETCLSSDRRSYIYISLLLLKRKASENVHWTYFSFNLRSVITPVNIREIEIRERALDWRGIELEMNQVKDLKGNNKERLFESKARLSFTQGYPG